MLRGFRKFLKILFQKEFSGLIDLQILIKQNWSFLEYHSQSFTFFELNLTFLLNIHCVSSSHEEMSRIKVKYPPKPKILVLFNSTILPHL